MKTFRDYLDKEVTYYKVSSGGSFTKHSGKISFYGRRYHLGSMYIDLDSNKSGLNENGNIDKGWCRAIFLDVNEAASLAKKIADTKYNNKMKQIENIVNESVKS